MSSLWRGYGAPAISRLVAILVAPANGGIGTAVLIVVAVIHIAVWSAVIAAWIDITRR